MKKKISTLGIVLALVAVLVTPMAALASNEAGQGASTTSATTIDIMDQAGTTAITTITFPVGVPTTTVSDPSNNLDGVGSPQVIAATSTPVATLISGTAYNVHVTITDDSGWAVIVSNEKLYIDSAQTGTVDSATFSGGAYNYSNWGVQESITQSVDIDGNDLYLTIDLTAAAGKSGTSTITILGESP